jgi:hypothetical protein
MMSTAWPAWLALALLTPVPLAAQASPHGRLPEEGEGFCAQVFLRAEGRIVGHQFAAFGHNPDVAGRPELILQAEREAIPMAEPMALWWSVGTDSIAAYVAGEEETVWELRLGEADGVLAGTLRRVLPAGGAEVASAYTMLTPCGRPPS